MIGINTAIISPTGGSVGVGFAIPVNTAKRLNPQLISKGYVSYAYLGASVQPVIPELATALGLTIEKAATVIEVTPGGPADQAGLKGGNRQFRVGNFSLIVGGDVITQVNQLEIKDADDLIKHPRERKSGETINLTVVRDGKFRDIKVALKQRPKSFRR